MLMRLHPTTALEQQGPAAATDAGTRGRSAFWLALGLGVILAACKAVHVSTPDEWTGREIARYLSYLNIAAQADVLYAISFGLFGQVLLWLARRRPKLEAGIWYALLGLGVVSVFYGVLSVRVFDYLQMPLTFTMLYLAGDARNMHSSVAHYAAAGYVSLLVGVPVAYGWVMWWLRRRTPWRTWRVRLAQGLGAVVVVGSLVTAQVQAQGIWKAKPINRNLAHNPHYKLAASFVAGLWGDGGVALNEPYPAEYLSDFQGSATPPRLASARAPGPKNVIVVVLESVGTQYMSLYGSQYKTTPRLDEEARHAVVFDGFYSHVTNTANSLVAIVLAQYPPLSWREGTTEHPNWPGATLGQMLRERGHRTAFITSGDNDYANQKYFLAQRGFDAVWDYRDSGTKPHFSWGTNDRATVDMVLDFIDGGQDKPFYILAWTQGTHHPYEPSEGMEEIDFFGDGPKPIDDWDLGRYLNTLYEADKQLGRLFDGLRERKLDQDTLVVVTGDHGEAFGWPHPTWGHSYQVYQENVHVPLMVWNPRLYPAGRREARIGGHVDLAPTVANLLDLPRAQSWQGRSLFEPSHSGRAYFYGAMESYIFGVRQDEWKYILNATDGLEELYNLSADPMEQNNVIEDNAALGRELRQRVSAWVDYQRKHGQ